MKDKASDNQKRIQVTALEPRIMLSATWVDADTGEAINGPTDGSELFYGGHDNDLVDALGGDDILFGDMGADILNGGDGNDILYGEHQDDILNGGIGDDALYGGLHNDILISGGGNDYLDGGEQDDLFYITGAQDGDTITIEGGAGQDTIDLSEFSSGQIDDTGSVLTVALGEGRSVRIEYSGIETILTGDHNADPVSLDDHFNVTEDTVSVHLNVLANDTDADGDSLTITDYTQPDHGDLACHEDGTFTYTPAADYHGDDAFSYTVSDGNGGTHSATVNLTVTPVNDAPVAQADQVATDEDTVVTVNVLANDVDVDGDVLTVTDYGQAAHGEVVYNQDGTFTYTPAADYHGDDAFSYTVSDGNGGTHSTTVNLTVNSVNDAPVAQGDQATTNEDTAIVTVNVLANDTDIEGDTLTVIDYGQAGHGEVVYNQDGTFTYTPAADYHGDDAFTYTVSDGNGGIHSATVNLTVTPVNDAPVAQADQVATDEDTVVTVNVLANDVDVDGDVLTVTDYGQAAHGEVVYNQDGTFTYTPAADYHGDDAFSYTVSDGNGGTHTATVNLTVNSVNDAPVAQTVNGTTLEDTPLMTTNVLNRATDVDNDSLSIADFAQPAHGQVVYHGDGTFTYTPDSNYHGSDSFTYTVSDSAGGTSVATYHLSVTSVNDNPVLSADHYVTQEDEALVTGNVLANDTEVDGDDMMIHGISNPEHGTVFYQGNGIITYTPDPDYCGTDSFTYTVIDRVGGESTTTVTIEVTPVNDAPSSHYDQVTTDEDTPVVTGSVLENDSDIDGDVLTVVAYGQGSHGSVSYNDDGTFLYTPENNFYGTDSFTYTVSDGQGGTDTATVVVSVRSVNDAPVAGDSIYTTNEDTPFSTGNVLENDVDADGDQLVLVGHSEAGHGVVRYEGNGVFRYSPTADYNGIDSFTYTIIDGNGAEHTGTVLVNVAAVNDAPEAFDDTVILHEDSGPVDTQLFTNDVDVDGDLLSLVDFDQPEHGTLVHLGDGTFRYTPDSNFYGTDSFSYTITDGSGGSSSATVTYQVLSVNDAPVAGADRYDVNEDGSVTTGFVMANDTDVEENLLGITDFTLPSHGQLINNNDGTFTYTPDSDYNGIDHFTYTITDGHGATATATVTLTVHGVNDAPVAGDNTLTTNQNETVISTSVLANDTDIDNDALAVADYAQGAHGTVSYQGDGIFTYTPDGDYTGTDSFTYTISDGQGGSDTATVRITVLPVNHDPNAVNDHTVTDNDTAVTIDVLGNDSDSDGDSLTITGYTVPGHGQVTSGENGALIYTPDADFVGTDQFTYTVSDGRGGSDTATITIEVAPGNHAPNASANYYSLDEDAQVTTGNVLANDSDADGDVLTIIGFTQPEHGTLVYHDNGTFTYTPDENYYGSDQATYTVSDGQGGVDTAALHFQIAGIEDGVIANDDTLEIDEDHIGVTTTVMSNDIDIEGNRTLVVHDYSQGEHGTVSYNDDGTFTYIPDDNFHGTDSFTYMIYDGYGHHDTATVTVTVHGVNDAPDTEADSYVTREDVPLTTGNVLSNDSDVDGDALTLIDYSQPEHGAVVYHQDGTFTYTPDADYSGSDSFTYTVADPGGATHSETVSLKILSVNDAPVPVSDNYVINEDTVLLSGDVRTNDLDVDSDPLFIYDFTQPEHGTVRYKGDGVFEFTPDADYNGADSFTYQVIDGQGGSSIGTVNIQLTPVNDAPVPESDHYSTNEDTAITTGNVLANDTDIDGDQLVIGQYTQPAHGTVTYNQDGTFTYTPDENYNGSDSFAYSVVDAEGVSVETTVQLTVRPVNDAPVGQNNSYNLDEDTPLTTGNVLADDTDVDGNPLSIPWYTQPEHGTLVYHQDGTFTYTPDANYHGSDAFTYTVIDGQGGSDTVTVQLNIASINDTPVAINNYYNAWEDTPYTTGNVLSNDSDVDGDALTITDFTQPAHGRVEYNGNGTFSYTPDPDYHGYDYITYTVADPSGAVKNATIRINVREINDAPVAAGETMTLTEDTTVQTLNVLGNDRDVDGDDLSVVDYTQPEHGTITYQNDGTFEYRPDDDYYGNDAFVYTISDGRGGTATATFELTVTPVNDAPRLGSDHFTTDEDTSVTTINVLANDGDVEGDDITFTDYTQPAHGQVVYHGDGSFTYTPEADYHGNDAFTYTVSDGNGATTTGTVRLTVQSVNDAPVAAGDTQATAEDTAVILNVLANDSDVDHDSLSVVDFTQPEHGSVVLNPDGSFHLYARRELSR